MPREGVPYPERVLCSLKNTIAMIEQKLGLKIEKVNGVGPDPSGNVTLASGDSALTVEEDASQHLITIGLDRAELPTAAVTSVNGETGVVSLDASEIPGKGANKTVMDNINTLETVGLQMRSDLNDEINARENADAVLQTNINNVTASLPGAAAAAVAADPTIASLVAADSQNVKLSGNQSISGIKTVSTEATGTYSSQIANSQKVYNELQNYPSMVRTANAQTIAGVKSFNSRIDRVTGISPSVSSFIEGRCINYTDSASNVIGYNSCAKSATANFVIMGVVSQVNPAHYSKLFIRLYDNGKADLIMESSTSQGYQQYVIHTFGS